MSNLRPLGGQRQPGVPTPPKGEPIARYQTYLEAQRAVDFLSDNQFPVQFVTIVGSGLRMVERVTGRLTYGRVAVAGAASGAWFGLFVGLLMSLFGSAFTSGAVAAAVAIGAAFGMMFGVISYALTGGRRDFTSTSQIVASEYEVLCMPEHSRAATELLGKLPGGAGRMPAGGPGTTWPATGGPAPGEMASGGVPHLPPPTGRPSPGPGPGQPGGPPEPTGWSGSPAAQGGARPGQAGQAGGEPATQPEVPVTGPTYGEMIEKKRREERERAEREMHERVERERAERERAEQERPPPAEG